MKRQTKAEAKKTTSSKTFPEWSKQLGSKITLIFLLLVGFFYRFYGLRNNYSFWNDEGHVAIFVRAILERGQPVLDHGYSTGVYQWLWYWLGAVSARIFGLNEFALRFPSLIFGVLTIWAIWLLGRELFPLSVSEKTKASSCLTLPSAKELIPLLAAFFITFLNIEILWSRQARPYQAMQFFYLLAFWFVWRLVKEKKLNWRYFLGFLGSGVLVSLLHGLGIVILLAGVLFLAVFRFNLIKKWLPLSFLAGIPLIYAFRGHLWAVISSLGRVNNLFYYRVFLWHDYPALVLLALIGGLALFIRKEWLKLAFLAFPLALQITLISLLLPQPFVRYFYIVFPFLILLGAIGLTEASYFLSSWKGLPRQLGLIRPRGGFVLLLLLALLFATMGHKFTLRPRRFYSLSEDMQEVPEVDYKKIYAFIEKELQANPEAVFISNWNDHPIWYLGEGGLDYLLRVPNHKTEIDPVSGARHLWDLDQLKGVVADNSRGLILLESWETKLPSGVREYITGNLKKELEVDRLYPVQPRYWPVEVYSWGIARD